MRRASQAIHAVRFIRTCWKDGPPTAAFLYITSGDDDNYVEGSDGSFPLLYSRAAIEPHVVKVIRLSPE